MKTFTIENETNNIVAHATKQEAALVSNAEIFSSDTDLAELGANWPAPRLIEIWNSIPGNTPVRKFTDRKTAATRIWKAIQSLGDSIPAETPTEPAETEASPDMPPSEEAPLPESEQVEVETPASEPEGDVSGQSYSFGIDLACDKLAVIWHDCTGPLGDDFVVMTARQCSPFVSLNPISPTFTGAASVALTFACS